MESTEITQENPAPQKIEMPVSLTQQQAIQVLFDAVKIGQTKGIYTLDDAELINKAIRAFMPPVSQSPNTTNPQDGPVATNP